MLGAGEFGEVYLGVVHKSGSRKVDCAVKTLKKGGGTQNELDFLKEAAVMGDAIMTTGRYVMTMKT